MTEIEPVLLDHPLGGSQAIFRFPNGYGASVISTPFSYGVELAVIRFTGEGIKNYEIDYSTPITEDVVGDLDPGTLRALLSLIQDLPSSAEQGRLES